ncbi:TonB-dependent receptor domain-containing protein [Pelagimonas varians]|uniref:Heme transporter BhuA n=1 Tax=Pelagimonas varians TaxID=696760 RepID=A0A238KEL0_9RHOB|nr:TonB-dependent receptor [Pelagimonas varians]PYG32467.1 hemoglobin/transferrin/lactoferrin receptor protein [Pelagimonas varians]SMX41239.1 Heme transporter BhuA precursor [Pelagimonas varians]
MRHKLLKTFLLTSVCAAPLYAQDAPFESNAIYLGTIAVAGGADVDAINDKDVTAQDLDRKNPVDLQDLFRSEPTISVGSSIPASQKVYVNGIEESRLGVTIDGARQNNKVFHHATTNLIDPALLKSVRVDPGVAPADAGPGALAGVIAFETKDVDDLLETGEVIGGRAKLQFSDNGNVWTKSGAAYGRYNGFEALLYLKKADGGLQTDGDGNSITGSKTNLTSGLAKLAYEAQSGDRIELSYERVKDDAARPYRGNIGLIIGGRPLPLTRTYELDRSNLVLTYTDESPEGWWDPKVVLSMAQTEINLPEEDQNTFGKTKSFSGVFQNKFALAAGSVTAGLDFFRDEAEMDYESYTNPAWNDHPVEKLNNVGVFAQARLEPMDALRLSFGARVDWRELTGVDGSNHSDSGVSGNIAAEYDITPNVTLSGGYSHIWGGIDLAENFIMNSAWTYDPDGFETVTADNMFVAATGYFGDWTINGKIFKTNIDNARNASYRGGPNPTVDLETRGYELGVAFNWADGFAKVAYANIESDIDGRVADSYAGNYLTMPLGEMVTLAAMHEFKNTGWRIGGDVEHALENTRTYDYATGGDGPALPAYTVVNTFAEFTPRNMDKLVIRAEINNLFDETYAARATYGQDFSDEVEPLYEPGRTFRISAAFEF